MRKLLAVLAFTLFVPGTCFAAEFTASQKDEIDQMVHDYILENPSVIVSALEKYQGQQEELKKQAQNANIEKHSEYLFGKDLPSTGPDAADVTIVEFFDYNCGYCRRALNDIMEIIEDDKKVKFVWVDLPILNPASEVAAKWALAADRQGKYFEFHKALMHKSGAKTETALEEIAKSLSLDVVKLREDVKSSEVENILNQNRKVASEIGVTGTPAFIIGKEMFGGYIGMENMRNEIKNIRDSRK